MVSCKKRSSGSTVRVLKVLSFITLQLFYNKTQLWRPVSFNDLALGSDWSCAGLCAVKLRMGHIIKHLPQSTHTIVTYTCISKNKSFNLLFQSSSVDRCIQHCLNDLLLHMETIVVKAAADFCNGTNYYWCVTTALRCPEVTVVQRGRRMLCYHQPQEMQERKTCCPSSEEEVWPQSTPGWRRADLLGEKLCRKMRRWPVDHMTCPPQPITAPAAP